VRPAAKGPYSAAISTLKTVGILLRTTTYTPQGGRLFGRSGVGRLLALCQLLNINFPGERHDRPLFGLSLGPSAPLSMQLSCGYCF
jgi:hypothetical protein